MKNISVVVLCWMSCIQAVFAGPADYIYTPAIEYGEREIDIKYGASSPLAGNSAQAVSVGLGLGVTENWFSEVYLKQEQSGSLGVALAEWENKFKFTETGEYPVDVGMIAELEAPLSGHAPWELRLGPLFQTEYRKLQLNGNLLFSRAFGSADENGVPFCTNFGYQWQIKYRWLAAFEFGMQGMGDMGKWDNWSGRAEQNHRIGPAIFGKFSLGKRQAIRYNAAWLMGASTAAPQNTVRTQLEYEF